MKKILPIGIFMILLFGCFNNTVENRENSQQEEIRIDNNENQISEITPENSTLTEWWNYKYTSIPDYKDKTYIKDFDIETLMSYYRVLSIENFNTKGSSRYSDNSEKIAEKMGIRKEIFDELDTYVGLSYYKYLKELTMEYFEDNNLGIIPDYYSPINSTVYIGVHTFNCEIQISKCKDDPDFQTEVDKTINYLRENLPEIIQGFRIFSVRYECDQTGTSGSVNKGYIWLREGNTLLEMEEGKGTYGKQLPEDTLHWHQDSWSDGKIIENIYSIEKE